MKPRIVALLRHGEYDLADHGSFGLTTRGRDQARLAGQWVKGRPVEKLYSSGIVRAKETAEIISPILGMPYRALNMLGEGVPTAVKGLDASPETIAEDRARMDRAYAKFFTYKEGELYDLIVCHANLIRYFVCKALGVNPRKWTKMVSNHASCTEIMISSKGVTRLLSYNEAGYLPHELRT